MTALAAVLIRRRGKLAIVLVFMAIQARRKLHFVNCIFAGGNMAFVAFHSGMLAFERIFGSGMLLYSEQRRLPTIHIMTFRALPLHRPSCELAAMRIDLVAINAHVEFQRLLEIAAHMACRAADRRVLSKQGILRFRVIERKSGKHILPTGGGVALLARLFEFTVMRIHVACLAGRKIHVLEARGAAGHIRFMAQLTLHVNVHARQGVLRFRVIELFGCLPIADVVATLAFGPQLAFVIVLMAGNAFGGKSDVRACNLFILNQRFEVRGDVPHHVTLLAGDARVLAFERITRLLMVELPNGRLPAHQCEIQSVVLQVTSHAILAIWILHPEMRVIAVPIRK